MLQQQQGGTVAMEDWSAGSTATNTEEEKRRWTEQLKVFAGILDAGVTVNEDGGGAEAGEDSNVGRTNSRNSQHHHDVNVVDNGETGHEVEGWQEQIKGFFKSTGELLEKFGEGVRDVAEQSLGAENTMRCRQMWDQISPKLEVFGQFLPEDRSPVHVWIVVLFVTFLTLTGIPGIKHSLLEEFGVRLVTYDLPGFGQSDPHSDRNLTSSALDMKYIADTLALGEKFWVLGHAGGGIHAWAAIRYIPERLAGAALIAPMGNPYESDMIKDETRKIWEKWTLRRKLGFILAKRASYFLPYFYKRSLLKNIYRPDKALSFTLGKKDLALAEQEFFVDFQLMDMQESMRQDTLTPFVEETILEVNKWGFSLADLQVRKKQMKGIKSWFHSLFNEVHEEWEGFLGPIHIWQGMDDRIVPYPLNDYAKRMVPGAILHKLIGEGHFSYFYFCDECHREIFITLFGIPRGTLSIDPDPETAHGSESAEDGEL
ncbi:uncharacterized protein LOC131033773 isoform X2 [Cryptomeria japonica]|uniref:uncharacterized protein LOC131033773 isoform X2 n=1 Tax=Cryptomeria japonica TaxID=3369 RepID=UPI0025ABE8A9|nr:uncharacterized protein LOC131033773 isoform X2 [Cryptomeria japonica]